MPHWTFGTYPWAKWIDRLYCEENIITEAVSDRFFVTVHKFLRCLRFLWNNNIKLEFSFANLQFSCFEKQLPIQFLHWKRRFWESLARWAQEVKSPVCNERNVEGENNHKAQRQICDKWALDIGTTSECIHCQYVLRLSRSRKPLSCYGLSLRRWP